MDCEEFARSKAEAQEDSSLHVLSHNQLVYVTPLLINLSFLGDRSNLWVEAVPKV